MAWNESEKNANIETEGYKVYLIDTRWKYKGVKQSVDALLIFYS